MAWKIITITLVGGLGALSRWALDDLVQKFADGGFPWGTLVVNCSGCLAFGIIWSLAEDRLLIPTQLRFLLLVGFCGAFTTFSTFAFENSQFIRDGQWIYLAANVMAQNVLGILCVMAGTSLTKLI